MLTAHLGNWEVLVRAGAALGVPVSIVTRRFRAAWAERAWRRLRRGGAGLIVAEGGARAVLAALAAGEVVGYVLDQHMPPRRAVWVPFFGRPAATSPDLARLARLTGAPVVPLFTWRGPDGRHVVEVQAPVALPRTADAAADILEGTRRCAAVVEAAVRARPEQWLWIHRRWKPPPPAAAAILAAADVADVRRAPPISGAGAAAR
ncbi:MAG: lysophospholipid acyltransferase family protein [Myxococcales bacterium]|nr:lysophospholipid acyltransferase family protein [Myxococcales bacterium]